MTQNFRLRPLFVAFFAAIAFIPSALSQLSKHANIWHFGNRAGLDFTSGQPVKLTNINVDSYEGCATWCDANGQLQLYTNGGGFGPNATNGLREGIIWNRNQQTLYSLGSSQGGGYSATQSALVLPKPGSATQLYVFTMDHNPNLGPANRGLSYFVVDMSLGGGLGAVTQADVRVHTPAAECLTAIPNAAGNGFWVVTIDRATLGFAIVPVNANGVGTPVLRPRNGTNDNVLVLKASPDGRFLCADGEIYAFDAATGIPTFREKVPASNYTLSFSPRSRYLYTFESDVSFQLVQYDLSAAEISKSGTPVPTDSTFTFPGLMQLGPDGNIYYIEQSEADLLVFPPTMSLSVIRCPDDPDPRADRAIMTFETDPENGAGLFTSLPNFADYIFALPDQEVRIEAAAYDTCSPFPLTLRAIASTSGPLLWSNGSTADSIVVNDFGEYWVELRNNLCDPRRDTLSIQALETCCKPFTPNAFTPNSDQNNDSFSPVLRGCRAEYAELRVYARWGELMYQGINASDRWDGMTLNGTPAPPDVYVYTFRYKLEGEEERLEKGEVTLLR
jgi:gliding motility-associated-like protein